MVTKRKNDGVRYGSTANPVVYREENGVLKVESKIAKGIHIETVPMIDRRTGRIHQSAGSRRRRKKGLKELSRHASNQSFAGEKKRNSHNHTTGWLLAETILRYNPCVSLKIDLHAW